MVLIVDKKIDKVIVDQGYCVIPSLSHFSFTTFLDMCVIYESTDCVKTFFDSFRAKSNLTKYELFQLGFYLEGLNAIKDPSLYYVNKNEIELANEFYDLWKITNTCESLINTITSTIDVFSFTFQYQTNKKEKLSSKMFAIFTIILGFTTLYDFF
ncbi:MAG: hypothetical protein SO253_00960 [Bacilli bacterium]|nr:hypothetical protein [Bacilli bacterium]